MKKAAYPNSRCRIGVGIKNHTYPNQTSDMESEQIYDWLNNDPNLIA